MTKAILEEGKIQLSGASSSACYQSPTDSNETASDLNVTGGLGHTSTGGSIHVQRICHTEFDCESTNEKRYQKETRSEGR